MGGGHKQDIMYYRYVQMVLICVCTFLNIARSVSLVFVRFLRNALECNYARVWYLWLIIWRFTTYCALDIRANRGLMHRDLFINTPLHRYIDSS